MTDDAPDPRDAVLELLLDARHDPGRREELRALVERDSAALMELRELERVDDLLRTAGPMVEPSEELAARIMAIPDQEQAGAAELPWEAAVAEPALDEGYDDALEGAIPPPPPEGPTFLADVIPPPSRPRRDYRRERNGFWRNLVVWRAATVACAAAALVLGVMAFSGDDDDAGEPVVEATTVTVPAETGISGATIPVRFAQGERGTGTVVAEPPGPEGRRVHIVIEGLARTPRRVYTVWIARSRQARIPLGTFKQDAQGNLDMVVTIPPGLPPAYRGIWVTREPQTGKRGWSADWVIRAPLS